MMLDLIGGTMHPAQDWALSIAELESLGFSDRHAKRLVGVPPSYSLEGRWVLLIDDEQYVPGTSRVIEIRGEEAICSRHGRGKIGRLPKMAVLRFATPDAGKEEVITITGAPDADYVTGQGFTGADLPGDPRALWDALEDADDDDPRHDTLPHTEAVWLYREEIIHSGALYEALRAEMGERPRPKRAAA